MLISIAGSQGVGKSTCMAALSSTYPCVERKTSRSILSDWQVTLQEVNSKPELTIKFQEEILKRKIEDEIHAVEQYGLDEPILTERSFADLFVYALVALGSNNNYNSWINDYHDRCMKAQKEYSAVFFLKAGHFQPVNDGVRGINRHYSNMVDTTLHLYTSSWSADSYYQIDTADQQMRTNHITNIIERL
jgi:hypothetical protein